jgi:hypothetical protein
LSTPFEVVPTSPVSACSPLCSRASMHAPGLSTVWLRVADRSGFRGSSRTGGPIAGTYPPVLPVCFRRPTRLAAPCGAVKNRSTTFSMRGHPHHRSSCLASPVP